jgi:hypothetical protein
MVPAPASTAGMVNTPVPTILPTTSPVADVSPKLRAFRSLRDKVGDVGGTVVVEFELGLAIVIQLTCVLMGIRVNPADRVVWEMALHQAGPSEISVVVESLRAKGDPDARMSRLGLSDVPLSRRTDSDWVDRLSTFTTVLVPGP